jgi:hypothetical protein
MRRQSAEFRQLAIKEIDLVVAKYQDQKNLKTNVLESYQATLTDNSYLTNTDFVPDLLAWHTEMESTLKKTTRFEDLWPSLIKTVI